MNFWISSSPLELSIDHTDNIVDLVNEWFPTGKFMKVDTHFWAYSAYKKELIYSVTLTINSIHKE